MKINEIIGEIDKNYLFVPAFQREYVWKKKDAKNLVSSLINEYPTGTMLTWKTTNPPELKGDYAYDSTKGAVKLILDGQQRITTLYMLMTGEIPPYYTEKEILNDIRGLHVNIETLNLEYFRKTIMENDPTWIDITEIFKGNVRTRDIIDNLEQVNEGERLPRERENRIDDNIEAIKRIKEREFLEQVIPVKASIKEAIDIFYIVNSSGVNLTDAELALAQISGYWPTAREEFKAKLDQLKSKGWVLNLDFIVYALLATVHRMGSKMEKLHTADNKEKIQEAWKILDSTVLDYTFNLLQSQAYIDHTDEINSVYALIPIITYVYLKPNHKLNEEEIKKIVKWFYYSQIRTRYTGQLPQKLDKDLKIVGNSESPFDELLKIIEEERPLEIKPSEFVGRDIRHPLFSLMRWYFKSQNAVCLGTGLQLRQNMGKKYELERDHIFAYSVLRDSEYYDMNDRFDYALAQEITNRAILTSTENRGKSAQFADIYLSQIKDQFPNALKLQCIPDDENLWRIENYKDFLQVRRKLLAEKLNYFLNNISIINENIKTEIDLEEIIESGEHSFLEFKSTMRWNVREGKLDKKMEEIILKSVAAFNNSEGGKLLIGVEEKEDDVKDIRGLEDDYNTLREANKDFFELHLRSLINNAYGKDFSVTGIKINFPVVQETEICEVDVKAGTKPIYLEVANKNGQKDKKFYVRNGNRSDNMDIAEAAEYIKQRFEDNRG
jgi:uncharacterized protein with ParB-like and HNH nuclease domain